MSSRWLKVEDGEWVAITAKGHKNACCDCGLVHTIDYRIAEDGSFQVRFKRDNRATGQVRRKMKKPVAT
jgi:hypothetical protein